MRPDADALLALAALIALTEAGVTVVLRESARGGADDRWSGRANLP